MFQTIIDDGQTIDYYYFTNLLRTTIKEYSILKRNNLISQGDINLRKFKNIHEYATKLNNINLTNKNNPNKIHTYFDSTLISNIAYKLKQNNDYDTNVDNVIRELYYEKFDIDIIDVTRIYTLIEEREGIKTQNKSNSQLKQFYISSLLIENNNIDMSILYVSDKTIENIGKKIQRKYDKLSAENIPWSIKLIKDWKRMSIIFKTEKEIFIFIQHKKKFFGENFEKEMSFENNKILIRIQEIKNGFYDIKSEEESGNYRDVKIIYEVILIELDMSFCIECQLNLENLIIYKKVDHIIYDFERAREEFEIIKVIKDRYEWMEGNYRVLLQILRIIFIIIAISSFGISLGIFINDINLRLKTIWHANDQIQVKFIHGLYPNNICYSVDYDYVNCVGYTKISELIQKFKLKNFRKLLSNGYSLIGIDSSDKFISRELSDFKNIEISEKIYDIKQNNNLLCYTTDNNLNCFHKYIFPNLISVYLQICISANNIVECSSKIKYGAEIPPQLSKGVDLLGAGPDFSCASREDIFLCWGNNSNGQLDIPEFFKHQVVRMFAIGFLNVCAATKGLFTCWGFVTADIPSVIEIPKELESGAELAKLGSFNGCAVRLIKFYCWGYNNTGINDIPDDYKYNVSLFALNEFQVCAYNGMLICWGADFYKIGLIPYSFANSELILLDMIIDYICASTDSFFDCWGDGYDKVEYPIPYKIRQGVDQLSVGLDQFCISIELYLYCMGGISLNNNVSDEIVNNWGLPSLEHKITLVYHCDFIICIFKGSLLCYAYDEDVDTYKYIYTPPEMRQSKNITVSYPGTICGINDERIYCWDDTNNFYIPEEFSFGSKYISLGVLHICGSTETLLDCWGDNSQGQIDVPEEMAGVISLSTKYYANCASTKLKLNCWGTFVRNDEGFAIDDYPEHLKRGVEQVEVSLSFACALKAKELYCWGRNFGGVIDIPEVFQNNPIELFSVGYDHICTQTKDIFGCYGSYEYRKVPYYMERNGVDNLLTCDFTNCAEYNEEWICWGKYGLQQRLNVTNQYTYDDVVHFDITNDYELCMKIDGQLECKSKYAEYERYEVEINVSQSLICMYVNLGRPLICYVDALLKSKFSCITGSKTFVTTYIVNYSYTGDSEIVKISCGSNHGCALFESGEVHCFGGSIEYEEADLPKDMMDKVYDVRAGTNSTCILNEIQILCRGKDIDTQRDGYQLSNLDGLDEMIKIY